jgi:hypothetical protein
MNLNRKRRMSGGCSLLLAGLISACGSGQSEDVNQNTILQTYTLRYKEAARRVLASAEFHYENRFGTSLRLTGTSAITFQNQPMSYQNVFSRSSYVSEYTQVFRVDDQYIFRYRNNDGFVYEQEAQIPQRPLLLTLSSGSRIEIDRDLAIRFAADRTDSVTICLATDQRTDGTSQRWCQTAEAGRDFVIFEAEDLAELRAWDELQLEVEARRQRSIDGGRVEVQEVFEAAPILVYL